ncbi:MAG: glycosyltransferase [Chitinophagaceae bacterium]|nr:glycosyltransferase [Chitinophagaceae bacterium]
MTNPKISIIIPCYNLGDFLKEAIASVEEVFNPELHELIIVDDGSTDDHTRDIVSAIREHIVIRQPNGGLSKARNTGISRAKGEYLIFLDADNLLTDGYLTKGVEILDKHPEIDIVYGDSEMFGHKSKDWGIRHFNLQTLMLYNYIDACCLVRKTLFDEIGGFDENMPILGSEDWEMWLRAAYNHKKFYYMEGVTIQKYRVRENSMIRVVDKRGRDSILDYLQNKYPDFLSYTDTSDFYYGKFETQTIGWTAKLFIKKYFPSLFKKLVKKGKLSKYV